MTELDFTSAYKLDNAKFIYRTAYTIAQISTGFVFWVQWYISLGPIVWNNTRA